MVTSISRSACRIVHITTVPQSLGFLRGQIGYMKNHGLELTAISSPGDMLAAFQDEEGIPTHAVDMPRSITPARDILALIDLIRHLRRIKPDIVHGHTPKGGLLSMLSATAAHSPVRIYHMRGLPLMTAQGIRRTILRASEWLSCRLAHQVICVSPSLRQVAIDERLCPPEKIVVLAGGSGNGVDASGRFNPDRYPPDHRRRVRDGFGIPSEAMVIGFVGRLVRDKGIIELERAWQSLSRSYPNTHLLLVGPFETGDPVPDDVRERLSHDPKVHLTNGLVDTPPLYSAMDLVVLPTHREGFPNVPLEAASMRLPVVATRIPGCVDAIADGATGTLVEARDVASLTAAVARYLDDPQLRHQHGNAGRARALKDFRQEVIWEAIRQEYIRLLDQRQAEAPIPGFSA